MNGDRDAVVVSNRRAVRLLAAGGLVSSFGDGAAITALAYIVYQRTHSPMLLSLVYLLSFGLVGFLTPPAGWLADHTDRRRLIIASEVGSAVCFAGVALASHSIGLMLTLVFTASVFAAPIWPALGASIPNLVGVEDLRWANGVLSVTSTIGRTAGPVMGGMLIPVIGGRGVFTLDAVTFAVLAGFVALARGRYQGAHEEGGDGSHGLWAGFRYVAADRTLLLIVAGWTLMFLSMDMVWVADAPLAQELGVGSLGFGLISTLYGIGAVCGGLAGRRLHERGEAPAILSGTFGVTAGFVLVWLAPWFAVVLLGQSIAAFVDTLGGVGGTSLFQRVTPDRIRGRVFAVVATLGPIMSVPAYLAGGALTGALGPRGVYLVGAVIASAAGLVMLPAVRSLWTRAARPQATVVPED